MARPTKLVVDCSTGLESQVELTDEEIAQAEIDSQLVAAELAQIEAEKQAKAEAKANALAKLTALGLTEDEANALVG